MMEKTIPAFKTGEEAEHFVGTTGLREYSLKGQFVRFELKRKDKPVTLRLPDPLLTQIRDKAMRESIPDQRCMRLAIERSLAEPRLK